MLMYADMECTTVISILKIMHGVPVNVLVLC